MNNGPGPISVKTRPRSLDYSTCFIKFSGLLIECPKDLAILSICGSSGSRFGRVTGVDGNRERPRAARTMRVGARGSGQYPGERSRKSGKALSAKGTSIAMHLPLF